MITTYCPACDKEYKLKETALGKRMACSCGEKFIVEEEAFEEESEGPRNIQNKKGYEDLPDLSKVKICGKCKKHVSIDTRICPHCKWDTTSTKYDKQRREEITNRSITEVYKYGKFVFPGIILAIVLIIMNAQYGQLNEIKKLEKKVTLDLREISDKGIKTRLAGNTDFIAIIHFKADDKMPHFLATKKDGTTPSSLFDFGDGYFTTKTPGFHIIYQTSAVQKYKSKYYLADKNSAKGFVEIDPEKYDFVPYEALTYTLFK